jgi:hypothetical protein
MAAQRDEPLRFGPVAAAQHPGHGGLEVVVAPGKRGLPGCAPVEASQGVTDPLMGAGVGREAHRKVRHVHVTPRIG